MSQLYRIVDLYTDEVLAPSLDRLFQQAGPPPSMAQIQLLFRRAQSVRHAGDLFRSQGPILNTGSFESWLEHRIALAERRRSDGDKAFFTTVRNQLFGDQPEALRRATNKRLAEAGIQQPLLEQRTEVQMLLFRRWVDCFFARLRHAVAKNAHPQDRRPAPRHTHHSWRTP